jgi:hypothetical protein
VIDCGVLKSSKNLWYSLVVVEVLLDDDDDDDNNTPCNAGLNATTNTQYIGIYLNPTDSRCYRMIARPLCLQTTDLAFNRDDDLSNPISTSIAVALVGKSMRESTGLFVQSLHLGNNSMVSGSDGELQLGNDKEPYFHHVHYLLCRGNPELAYFEGALVLGGPPIGVAFQAQGKGRVPEEMSRGTTSLV